MKVLFTTLPGVGHLFPMVPLAWALQAAGHTVLVATDRDFLPIVTGTGIPGTAVLADVDLVALLKPAPADHTTPSRPRRPAEQSGRRCASAALDALPAMSSLVARWRPDLVISEPMEFAGPAAATAAGLPWIRHCWGLTPAAGLLDVAVTAVNEGLVAGGGQPLGDPLLAVDVCPGDLQIPGTTGMTPMRYVPYNGPADVPDWLLDEPDRPRVALTLGTVLPLRDPQVAPFWRGMIEELADLGQEVVIGIDAAHRPLLGDLPDGVRVGWIPLSDLLPTCTAIVHHGGSGCTMTAAAHGVPQLIVPHFADQFGNANRVSAIGAGVCLSRDTTDREAIRAACAQVTGDGPHREVSRRLAAENRGRPSPADVAAKISRAEA